ncbi:MAG TPA: hypothetical protein VI455_12270 [Terriglobia bacterium]
MSGDAGVNGWHDKVWHSRVHGHLGERLYHFLVRLRHFDPNNLDTQITTLLRVTGLGGIRVFRIFGLYDLLIRAWLHPSIEDSFRQALEKQLVPWRAPATFAVTSIEFRSDRNGNPGNLDIRDHDLASLDDRKIVEAQEPGSQTLAKLLRDGLVIERQPVTAIRFYVGVSFGRDESAIPGVVNRIQEALQEKTGRFTKIFQFSIYRGYGFASILIKGKVKAQDYFSVVELPTWIRTEFSHFDPSTETYLVSGDDKKVVGDERIGKTTLTKVGGKDLFVQSIVPELYYDRGYPKEREVEQFLRSLKSNWPDFELTPEDKQLLHDYLLAFLEPKQGAKEMAKVLYLFFAKLEYDLREGLYPFLNRKKLSFRELSESAKIKKEKGEFLSLGDLVTLYTLAIRKENLQIPLPGSDLAKLRNEIAHGASLMADRQWREILMRLLNELPGTRQLLTTMQNITTGAAFDASIESQEDRVVESSQNAP